MKQILLILSLLFIITSCTEEKDFIPNDDVEFYVSKHNIIQKDTLYHHEITITIDNFTGEFSCNGTILNTYNNFSVESENQYTVLKPYKNYRLEVIGFCNNRTTFTIKFTSRHNNQTYLNNFILYYGFTEDCELKMLPLKE